MSLMARDFDAWLTGLRNSIADFEYYINFKKVHANVDKIKVELNILNSLIGSKDIEAEFKHLISRYPEVLKCIPILIAVRKLEVFAMDEEGAKCYDFRVGAMEVEDCAVFMRKTGLFNLLEKHIVGSLVDYVTGVETGLDSNGRKNRGGHLMENLIERYIRSTGAEYYKEMYLRDVEDKWGLDLGGVGFENRARKRFDFVVKLPHMVYCIETNFYTGSGSKLNETARSYKMLAQELKGVPGVEFVWFTDGIGWNAARSNLKETFEAHRHVYNINDLEAGIAEELFGYE